MRAAAGRGWSRPGPVLDEAGANYRGVVLGAFQEVEDSLALLHHYGNAAESERAGGHFGPAIAGFRHESLSRRGGQLPGSRSVADHGAGLPSARPWTWKHDNYGLAWP